VERPPAPTRGTTEQTVFVSAQNAAEIQGLDLKLVYDPSKIAIVDVQAADQPNGFSAVWNDTPGTLQVALYGYAPINSYGARLLEITVRSLRGGTFSAPRLVHAQANEGLIPTRLLELAPLSTPQDGGSGNDLGKRARGVERSR
jgi:hypothetical protein